MRTECINDPKAYIDATANFSQAQCIEDADKHKKTDQGSLEPTISDAKVHLTIIFIDILACESRYYISTSLAGALLEAEHSERLRLAESTYGKFNSWVKETRDQCSIITIYIRA